MIFLAMANIALNIFVVVMQTCSLAARKMKLKYLELKQKYTIQ